MKLIWTFNCEVDMTLDEAKNVFFDFREGEFSELSAPFLVAGKGNVKITFDKIHFVVEFTDGHREFISMDKDSNQVAVQGEWWYRGEYTLSTQGGKTNVQLQVFNLADQEWLVSLMNVNAERKHGIAFKSLCKMAERKHA
jgi:hypothetical protein